MSRGLKKFVEAYLVVLPFVILAGPLVRKVADRMFSDKQRDTLNE